MKRKIELLNYLEKKTGLSKVERVYRKWSDNIKDKKRLFIEEKGNIVRVYSQHRKGGIKVICIDYGFEVKDLPIEKVDELKTFYLVYKDTPEDFGITDYRVHKEMYKEDEGSGWYSMQDVIEIDGLQFLTIY